MATEMTDEKMIEAVARAIADADMLKGHDDLLDRMMPKYQELAQAALRAVREIETDNKWVQAGEIFSELEKGQVAFYELRKKYMHSPALLSWFTRFFAPMIRVDGNSYVSLLPTPPKEK